MLTRRSQLRLFLGLLVLIGVYLLLPLVASAILTIGLNRYGYEHVMVQLGYPGLRGMRIPVVSFRQELGREKLIVSLTNIDIQYSLPQLLHGRVGRVVLPDVALQVLSTQPRGASDEEHSFADPADEGESPWSLLTAGDLLHRLPILPFDEVQLDRVTIFREQATGPLRKVNVSGSLMYRNGEIGGQLSFQGSETASYGLTIAGHSASTWSAMLVSQRLQAVPIVSWQSQASPNDAQIEVTGRLEVNVREFAPFIALLVPIGPDLGKVSGHVAVSWSGVAATDAVLTSIWRDPHTRLAGAIHAQVTLPALKGVAKNVTVAYKGSFAGNAAQIAWTLDPGVLLVATIDARSRMIPESIRQVLDRGDQPIRIDNAKPVRGALYWSDSPVRMNVEGPLHFGYGAASGPLVVGFEASRAEGLGAELVSVAGTFRVDGILPKSVTSALFAQEAVAGLRGSLSLVRSRVQAIVLPASSITAKQVEGGASTISVMTAQVAEQFPVQCDVTDFHCTAGPIALAIRAPAVKMMGRQFRLGQGMVRLEQSELTRTSWSTQGNVSIRTVALDASPLELPVTDWTATFAATDSGVRADVQVESQAQGVLAVATVEQPLIAGQGTLHATIGPIVFDGTERRLSKLVGGLPASIELTEGQIAATLDAAWSGGMGPSAQAFQLTSGTATFFADKLTAQYQEYRAKGISSTMVLHAQGMESIATVRPAPISMASIQTGVEITNLTTTVQGRWPLSQSLPILEIKEFRCNLFGGTVTSSGLTMDLGNPVFQTTLSLHDLDLAKILSVEQNQNLQGTGTLDGTVPVSVTQTGITVKDGVVTALPPGGVIRYGAAPESSKAISETTSQLHLVTQALNNFHYTLLRVGIDYNENGTLLLSARLDGRNPDLKSIPPINFNLTVQEHIPTLLKSLRLVEDIQGAVEKKHKRK
ncbi:MAG TPA: YdbH domain-containing protein [Nitrospira sp.]|nr:YdbH domain-containing protein [Nitrospira sp.]